MGDFLLEVLHALEAVLFMVAKEGAVGADTHAVRDADHVHWYFVLAAHLPFPFLTLLKQYTFVLLAWSTFLAL